MLDNRKCEVGTAADLDREIRDIFSLDNAGRGDEICGTYHIHYSDEAVKQATLLELLRERGVSIQWHKKS